MRLAIRVQGVNVGSMKYFDVKSLLISVPLASIVFFFGCKYPTISTEGDVEIQRSEFGVAYRCRICGWREGGPSWKDVIKHVRTVHSCPN